MRRPLEALAGVTQHLVGSAEDERRLLIRLAGEADATVLIAPEFDGLLLERVRAVERAGGRLLSPSSQLVALASDKHATAEHLARHDVPVPRGVALEPGEPLPRAFDYPAVLKPRDGAGSLGIEWIARFSAGHTNGARAARLERYYPGVAASVACLCGPAGAVPLEPCRQELAGPGDFTYLGGSLPIEPELASRARRLAQRAAATLPGATGYVGFDLVLGPDPAGSGDVVVEVNPPLTTSYLGLQALCGVNLAATMFAVAAGREVALCWNQGHVCFTSAGLRGSGF